MANPVGAFALAYLLSVVFTDELSLNLSYVERLVTYQQDVNFTELIPGALYNGTITARWAVPDAALSGIGAQTLAVKITASAPENSSVFFPAGGLRAKEAVAYLQCRAASGKCTEGSVLFVGIPVATSSAAEAGAKGEAKITLRSEITGTAPPSYLSVQQEASAVFESLKKTFSQNMSGYPQEGSPSPAQPAEARGAEAGGTRAEGANFSLAAPGNSAQNGNFLDSLKPEGDSRDPLLFLRENPLISIFALLIVIVITGAYLLNAKD